MLNRYAWSVVLLCAGLVMLCGCPPDSGTGRSVGGGTSLLANATTEPGIDFHRKNIGMPVTTLDYIGDSPLGLAGARDTGQVFFAVEGESEPELYVRDPVSLERRFLGQVPQLQQGTLAASEDGNYVVYCRQRDLERYIDDPKTTYPKEIAVVSRLEVATGKEDILFDFRDEPFKTYRNNVLTPSISPDGRFSAAVSYNMERLIEAKMLGDWLAIEADLRDRGEEMMDDERTEVVTNLRQLLVAQHVREHLKELGVDVAEDGPPVESERAAMEQFYNEQRGLAPALLLWEDGEARVLPLQVPEDSADSLVFTVGLTQDIVLVWLQPTIPDPVEPQHIYSVDLATGVLHEVCTCLGTPSTFEISQDGTRLLLVYNPTDVEEREITTETRLLSCPLDGSEPMEVDLQGDYLGAVDVVQDGRYIVGQDRDDLNMMLCDTQSQEEHLQLELPNAVSGVFIDQAATRAVILDAGVLYTIPLSTSPEEIDGYISEGYFEQFKPHFVDFLSKLGFDVQDDVSVLFEERWGLNTHEVSAQVMNPEQPGIPVLMRYDVDKERVVALWFPKGYSFDNSLLPLSSTALDYYEVKARTDEILDILGWLNPETRTVYQPGPNPLIDGRTDSYIMLYRDGYWLDGEAKDKWIVDSEVTVRIIGSDGRIAELSISETDPIYDQPFTLAMDEVLFYVRNNGEVPIPEDAPIRFDTDNLRYVIDMASDDLYGPAKYALGQRQRVCYEIDAYITPEDELIATFRVDTETGDVLGQLNFQPSSMMGLQSMGTL